MNNFEVMKECKIAYEILNDLLDNCVEDFDRDILEDAISELENIYSDAFVEVEPKQEVRCGKCGQPMIISDLIGYAYLCKECDENMYLCEGDVDYAWWLEKECE